MDINIEELEVKIAYLEDYISEINKIIITQDTKIEKLIRINNQLVERVSMLEENGKDTRDNVPPPHY